MLFENENISFLSYDEEHHRIALIASDRFSEKPNGPSFKLTDLPIPPKRQTGCEVPHLRRTPSAWNLISSISLPIFVKARPWTN
jgi:hypothetical protein